LTITRTFAPQIILILSHSDGLHHDMKAPPSDMISGFGKLTFFEAQGLVLKLISSRRAAIPSLSGSKTGIGRILVSGLELHSLVRWTCAASSGVVMPYFANTEGALAMMPARRPTIFASPLGHSRDKASPNDDADILMLQ
jgi:hypothetical protein